MFDSYDDTEKAYEVIFSDKTVVHYTAQQLYEFFIFNDLNIDEDFSDIKKRLDSGFAVIGDHQEYDWQMAVNVYKGKLSITRYIPPKIPNSWTKQEKSTDCAHDGKYINQAGGVRFWVCPKCKKDLGNA